MSVWMFPGQGSQKKGMGAEVFDAHPDHVKQADEILGYSIVDLCMNDSDGNLKQTQYTQPALFIVEALAFLSKSNGSELPDYAVGHSLGEYSALFAAGAFDFATGVKLVQKRGQLMSEQSGGGMLAVIGMPGDQIMQVLADNGIDTIDAANFNTPQQTVVSGPQDDIKRAAEVLQPHARMVMPLQVSAAFHSRYMRPAQQEFASFLEQFNFQSLKTKVIANVSAQPYTDDSIKDNLVAQIASSVRWTDTIKWLKQQGESDFVEVGPGMVLTNMAKQIS